MDHRIPKVGLVLAIVCSLLAGITFVILNEAFEGPSAVDIVKSEPYHLEAVFEDTEALPTKQPVLVRGVPVGKVTEVEYNQGTDTATVTFTVGEEYGTVNADASVTIGERTLLGDAYLNLQPGTEGKRKLESGDEVEAADSVDFDEALDFLDDEGRRHMSSTIETLDQATQSRDSGANLNYTVGELSRTITELRELTDALHGQETQLADLVGSSSVVIGELGEREQALRRIVGSGRRALGALAVNTESLEHGIAELPGVLGAGTKALRLARPLLVEARPMLREVAKAAPKLAPVLADIGPLAGDTIDTVKTLAGLPPLRELLKVVASSGEAVPGMEAAVRNLVPLLEYTAPRTNSIVSFFSHMASVTAHGDSDGAWARFAILLEPGELTDIVTPSVCRPEDDIPVNVGLCQNAYPEPNDALDPEPYEPGSVERLKPFKVPPPK